MRTLILLIFGVAALTAYGQGTIRYVNLGGIQFPSIEAGSYEEDFALDTPMDFDGNGTTDLIVRTRDYLQYTVPPLGNSVLSVRNAPPDSTSFAVPLAEGSQIGLNISAPLVWAGREDGGIMGAIGPFLSACYDTGCYGLFVHQTGYLGVQFEIDGQTHYGWVHLWSRPGLSQVYGYAYNTAPNFPIFAGQVPEPSTWSLIVLASCGFLVMAKFRSRKK